MRSTNTSNSKYSRLMLNSTSTPSAPSHPSPEASTSEKSSEASTSSAEDWLKNCYENPTFVAVLWGDAHCTGDASWTDAEDLHEAAQAEPSLILTSGVLVHSAPTHISVMGTIIEDGSAGGQVHVIPRGWIISQRELT